MKQFANKTSEARIAYASGGGWQLQRQNSIAGGVSYALRADVKQETGAPTVLLRVLSSLLEGMQVGMMAEGEAVCALSRVWQDGRVLKRSNSRALVALRENFRGLRFEDIATCAAATFCFVGFDGYAPEAAVFRSLMEGGDGADLLISCRDFTAGTLWLRFNPEKLEEDSVVREVTAALADCGRFLDIKA